MRELSEHAQAKLSSRLQVQTDSGFTFYGQLLQFNGQVYSSATGQYEASNPANWLNYVVPLNETIPTTGCYFGDVPGPSGAAGGTGPGAGTRLLPIYQQIGAQPASTDQIYLPAGEFSRPLVFVCELSADSAIVSLSPFAPAGNPAGAGGQRPVSFPERQSSLAIAQDIVNKLYSARLALATQPYASVSVDGQEMRFTDPDKLDDQIQFWERKCAVLSGKRRRFSALRLDRF